MTAQDAALATTTALSAGDTAWVLASTALVMLMVPGLALFYGGLVREKHSLNTLMMSQRIENHSMPAKRVRSAKPPMISAGVMIANVI